MVGVTKAAAMTGKSRATLYRKMHSGELSYTKDSDGSAIIDTSELIRVFGSLRRPGESREAPNDPAQDSIEMRLLQAEIARLQAELNAERAQKDLLRENVLDLRRMMLLLEHKEQPEAASETVEKKGRKGKKGLLK